MNEELKIIIKAVSDEAKKNLGAVREELESIKNTSGESGKSAGAAMQAIAKGAAVAIGSIVALTTAMANLGKKANEVSKGFAQMNTTFQNAGSTAAQASNTYKELYSFLGDHDKAVETAQSLALITTEEKALTEWTNILQGAFASMGEKLPIEGLAEAANETIKVGQVTGVMADALNWLGVSEDNFNAALEQTKSLSEREALVRSTLNSLYSNSAALYAQNNQAAIQYNQSQANLNIALAETAAYTVPLLTSLTNLGSTLLTVLAPALQTVAIYLTAFIQMLAEAISWVGSFFGLFSSKTEKATADTKGYRDAMNNYMSSLRSAFGGTNRSVDETIDKVQELKKQTMGFDELNVVSSPTTAATGSSVGGGIGSGNFSLPEAPNPADYGIGTDTSGMLDGFMKDVEDAKQKLEGVLVLVGLLAAGFAAWKIGSFISDIQNCRTLIQKAGEDGALASTKLFGARAQKQLDDTKAKLKTIGGIMLIVAGAILLVKGYSDAWANGIDWSNFAEILGGIALIIGGIALAFGPLAAAIATIVGGIAMLVLGIKDLVTNGYSMEAVIMVAVGAITVLIGVVWAFNAALLANPITWIVAAILGLVAVFVILWNECDGFRQFWINLWDAIVAGVKAAIDWIVGAFNAVVAFFKDNWQGLLLLLVNPFAGGFKLLYDNCDGFRNFIDNTLKSIGQFFVDLWKGIQNTFSKVGSFFKDVFTKAWEGVKNVFSKGGKIFDGIKDGIVSTFKTVVNGIIDGINKVVKLPFEGLNKILDKIHGIEIAGISPFSFLTWRAPIPQLPKLAKGGIVSSATTAIIGEAGREAVLPLENNTGWIDMLAEKLAAKQNTPSKIVLAVDGKELGYATINSINNITRQTGSLQLALI